MIPVRFTTSAAGNNGRSAVLCTEGAEWKPAALVMGAAFSRQPEARDACGNELTERWEIPPARVQRWIEDVRDPQPAFADTQALESDTIFGLTLSPYQLRAIAALPPSGGIMALGCGLGKTLAAVVAAALRISAYDLRPRMWIAAPANAFPTWNEAIAQLQSIPIFQAYEIEVVSLDMLHHMKHAASTGGVVIFDEAHMLGARTARRTKAAQDLRLKFDVGFCLTGSLLHAGIEVVMSVQDLAIPGASRFTTKFSMARAFDALSSGYQNRPQVDKPETTPALLAYLETFTVAVSTSDSAVQVALNLPARTAEVIALDQDTPMETTLTRIAQAEFAETGEIPAFAACLHKACAQGLTDKLDFLGLILSAHPRERFLVFVYYTESLLCVQTYIENLDRKVHVIAGGVSVRERTAVVAASKADPTSVILAQIDAGCVSLNLQHIQISIALERSWRAANYDQAIHRTWRRGQTKPCTHYDIIYNRIQSKVLNSLLAGKSFDSSLAEYQALKQRLALEPYKESL